MDGLTVSVLVGTGVGGTGVAVAEGVKVGVRFGGEVTSAWVGSAESALGVCETASFTDSFMGNDCQMARAANARKTSKVAITNHFIPGSPRLAGIEIGATVIGAVVLEGWNGETVTAGVVCAAFSSRFCNAVLNSAMLLMRARRSICMAFSIAALTDSETCGLTSCAERKLTELCETISTLAGGF